MFIFYIKKILKAKSSQTIYNLLKKFTKAGILKEIPGRKRNKNYVFQQLLDILKQCYSSLKITGVEVEKVVVVHRLTKKSIRKKNVCFSNTRNYKNCSPIFFLC